jgi:hypothetical protein
MIVLANASSNLSETENQYSGTYTSNLFTVPENLSKVAHLLVFSIDLKAITEGRSAGEHTVENKALHIQGSS